MFCVTDVQSAATRFYFFVFLLGFFLTASFAHAYPVTEKIPATETAPIDVLSSAPLDIFVPTTGDFADKLMFVWFSDTVYIVDLETWGGYATQPDTFTSTVVGVSLLHNGTSVIVAMDDGNLARFELDDEETFANTVDAEELDDDEDDVEVLDSRAIDLASDMTDPGITFMASDPDEDVIYLVATTGEYYEYNFTTNALTTISLETGETSSDDDDEETTATVYVPTGMVFAASSAGDRLIITTTTGEVIAIAPGSTGAYDVTELSSSAEIVEDNDANFADLALSADNDFVFIVDDTNDVIWVYSIQGGTFKDQQSSGTSLDPIEVSTDFNSTFTDITVFTDADDVVVAYVSGSSGITVLDAAEPDDTADTKVIDADTTDATVDEDVIAVSATPGILASTSPDTSYVFSANGDATISIFTDNPWISISSAPSTSLTAADGTISITFQADEAGTYTVYANSNPLGTTGTELIAATEYATADTDTTTAEVNINDFDRAAFDEGSNKIFVFVTDADGHLGHTAAIVTVDRPPLPITITNATFGNKKAYVEFEASPDNDIATYEIYAQPAEDQTSPTCPGSLTFTGEDTLLATLESSGCTTDTCEAVIPDLTNDVTYCIAMNVIDNAGQESGLSTFSGSVTPERTVGPAGFLGETSCALVPTKPATVFSSVMWFIIPVLILAFRRGGPLWPPVFTFFVICLLSTTPASARATLPGERTPQSWTLEIRGTNWFPTSSDVRSFTGLCCNFMGEVEFGYLFGNRYNVTATTGFGYNTGDAIGINNGISSGDRYGLMTIPVRLDFVYRLDLKSNQLFLPFARAGGDMVYFRESSGGDSIQNIKFGVHAGAGIGVLLDRAEQIGAELENDVGLNDVYLTIEARYALINSFKSSGLDFSGFYPYIGALFEF